MEKEIRDYEKGLSVILGKKIKEVTGYVSAEFGEDTLVFNVCRILFEDGTYLNVEGEHDTPYIPADNNDTWQEFYEKDE